MMRNFSLILLCAMIIGMVFFGDVVINEGNTIYDFDVTLGMLCGAILVLTCGWWLYLNRAHPVIGPVYKIVSIFFIALLLVITGNMFKNAVKDWWDS